MGTGGVGRVGDVGVGWAGVGWVDGVGVGWAGVGRVDGVGVGWTGVVECVVDLILYLIPRFFDGGLCDSVRGAFWGSGITGVWV